MPEDRDSQFVSAVGASLVAEAVKERRALLEEEGRLSARLAAAQRRVCAAHASQKNDGAPSGDAAVPWIDSSRALEDIKRRLKKAVEDEGELMALVGEVRVVKDERTEMALDFYSARTARLLEGIPVAKMDA